MSVVANVAINVDSRNAVSKLRQFQQQSSAAGRAAQELQKTTNAASAAATKAGREYQTAANGMRFFIDATGRARKENGQFVTTAEAAAAGLQKQGAAAKRAAGAMRSLGGVIASLGAGALVASMVRGAAAAEQLQLRLKLLSGEYGETARVQQFVSESAKTFGQSQIEAAGGVADVYARLRPLGVSLDQIETIYKGFNATALASGTSAEAASGAFLQLSQALGSGTLQGDEFRSVAEQVPGILRLVAGEMGVTVGELKKLGSEGKITSDVLINALAKGFDENSSKIKTLLDQSPAQRFKEFKDSTQALSNALGSELLPALIPIVKTATELLKLFGSLPGPVRTLIAAVFGLTAAFVALAPAISTAIGLLGGLSLATLAAAGPWVALAAGITAAAVALAGYRSEAQKVAGAAKTGTAADVVAARNLSVQKGQEISMLERQRKTASGPERAQIDRRLGRLRTDQSELQSAITASTADRPAAAVLPPAVTGGGAGAAKSAGGGGIDKAAEEEARMQARLRGLVIETNAIQKQQQIREKITQAEIAGDQQLAARLQGEERTQQILASVQGDIVGITDERERQAVLAKAAAEIDAVQSQTAGELNKLEADRSKAIEDVVGSLDMELLRIQANTDAQKQALQFLEIENQLKAQGITLTDGDAEAIRRKIAEIQKLTKEQEAINAKLQMEKDLFDGMANTVAGAFSSAFDAAVSGTENLGEALKGLGADLLATIGKMLIMYAIAQGLGALGGTDGKGVFSFLAKGFGFKGAKDGAYWPGGFEAFADGGVVTSPTMGLIGEGGEPEYVIPASKMRTAMSRYAGGARGNSVIPGSGAEGGTEQGGVATMEPIDVRYSVERINSVDYVTADQFQTGMARAAQQGAVQGERRAMRSLKNSSATRRSVGI